MPHIQRVQNHDRDMYISGFSLESKEKANDTAKKVLLGNNFLFLCKKNKGLF